MLEFLSYEFVQNALIAGVLSSILAGLIGTFIVTKRIVFISAGISHISFGGLGVAYYFGLEPLIGAMVFAVSSSAIIGAKTFGSNSNANSSSILTSSSSSKSKSSSNSSRNDSLIGILWSIGMAIGILFISLTPGYAPNLTSFLFGNILTVSRELLYYMSALIVITIALQYIFYNELITVSFDPEFAFIQGINVKFLNLMLMILVGVSVVMLISVAGITLVIAMLTISPITALYFTNNFFKVMLLSIIFGIISSTLGIFISFNFSIPSGPSIILVASVLLFIGWVRSRF